MIECKKFIKGNSMVISVLLIRGERKKMVNMLGFFEKKKK